MIKGEAKFQQQLTFQNARWNPRVANGTQKNGVVFLKRFKVGIGNGFAGFQIAASAQIKLGGLELNTRTRSHLANCLHGNSGYLRADSVAADNGNLVFTGHDVAPNNAVSLNITRQSATFAG